MEKTGFGYIGDMSFHRQRVIKKDTKVSDNISWFDGAIWAKIEYSVY
jgi:hypothetical protein